MQNLSEDFAAMLKRARRGDLDAMGELVRQYEPEVRLVARVRLGSALRPFLDSADLVQSVHRSVIMGLRADKFDISSPEQLVALALTIVRRKVARHWRHLKRQQRLSGESAGPDNVLQVIGSLCDPGSDPAEAAAFNDQLESLCREMNDTERRLIELRLQGYTTAEVARSLGLDADVLRVRLSRLRQRLRDTGVLTEWL
jgi:RNA polymerase sigma-70 factor (ECF subfamily)